MEKIEFTPELNEEPVEFFIVEQTMIAGVTYLLVTDQEEGDAQALILKDVSGDGEEKSTYAIVSEEKELQAVAGVFENMLDDIKFEKDE
ncbi:MAG: DUF1292 domain-containing protein [Lachnospiraceae bacterium]|nr:DUF1292 domain-containing protein [Lachnospiraceae bacterium]